jgi:hypothetical protein
MARIFVCFAAFALVSVSQFAPALARDGVPVQAQLSQAGTPSALPSALGTQVDSRVKEALSGTQGSHVSFIVAAIRTALDGVFKANATAITADTTLAVSAAREATQVMVATPGLDAPKHVQIAAAIAAAAAKAAPTAAASILVAVLQALPADEQTRQDAVIIADAIDAAVPDAQLTAALGTVGGANAPPAITTLVLNGVGSGGPSAPIVQLLTTAATQVNVSPH